MNQKVLVVLAFIALVVAGVCAFLFFSGKQHSKDYAALQSAERLEASAKTQIKKSDYEAAKVSLIQANAKLENNRLKEAEYLRSDLLSMIGGIENIGSITTFEDRLFSLDSETLTAYVEHESVPRVFFTQSDVLRKQVRVMLANNKENIEAEIARRITAEEQRLFEFHLAIMALTEKLEIEQAAAKAKNEELKRLREDELSPTIEALGNILKITNNDTYPWVDIYFYINGPKYFLKFANLNPHESTLLSFADFADSDGKRFEPKEYVVREVTIKTNTEYGRKKYTGNLEHFKDRPATSGLEL